MRSLAKSLSQDRTSARRFHWPRSHRFLTPLTASTHRVPVGRCTRARIPPREGCSGSLSLITGAGSLGRVSTSPGYISADETRGFRPTTIHLRAPSLSVQQFSVQAHQGRRMIAAGKRV